MDKLIIWKIVTAGFCSGICHCINASKCDSQNAISYCFLSFASYHSMEKSHHSRLNKLLEIFTKINEKPWVDRIFQGIFMAFSNPKCLTWLKVNYTVLSLLYWNAYRESLKKKSQTHPIGEAVKLQKLKIHYTDNCEHCSIVGVLVQLAYIVLIKSENLFFAFWNSILVSKRFNCKLGSKMSFFGRKKNG